MHAAALPACLFPVCASHTVLRCVSMLAMLCCAGYAVLAMLCCSFPTELLNQLAADTDVVQYMPTCDGMETAL